MNPVLNLVVRIPVGLMFPTLIVRGRRWRRSVV